MRGQVRSIARVQEQPLATAPSSRMAKCGPTQRSIATTFPIHHLARSSTRNMLYRTLVLGSALATTNALQIDSLPVRNDIVSRRQSFGAIAAFGLAVPAAFADDEYISPARAKILAAKEAELAKKGPSKVQAVADSSAQGRSGKAQ